MTDLHARSTSNASATPLPLWHQPDWTGPTVERRTPDNDDGSWPEGAVERVRFTAENVPSDSLLAQLCLPYTEHFGADGWPLHVPEHMKPHFDPLCQATIRRFPFTCSDFERLDWQWVALLGADWELRLSLEIEGKINTGAPLSMLPGS